MTQAQHVIPFRAKDHAEYPKALQGSYGVFHAMFLRGPHSPEQERWFRETCDKVETFVSAWGIHDEDVLSRVSLGIHCLADALFARLGRGVAWSLVDVQDIVTASVIVNYHGGPVVRSANLEMLADFYAHLGHVNAIDQGIADDWERALYALSRLDVTGLDLSSERHLRSTAHRQDRRTARKRERRARRKNRRR